ncbi:DUF881 domain-containing protein [Kitasatospora atroaurantiaca]|uniref:Uncharacterized protein YlxW (UPF0749 family) n=1 Tax=Kitasatospora atroaurantiaca TaxID=285545 RepID=A0A561EK83_9ACTN|nr:DUF881 domain-containing protein [Kitasatospora atroaurantiaca]TWE16009.1 uncharacterized protein YlxW (UPF0749 family) [Kitasatospora atroaurantiaca]
MPAQPTPSDREGRFSRPDASMSLLTTVMEHSLDDGYAEAARAKGAEGSSKMPTSVRGRLTLALGLALVVTVVTVGAVTSHEAEPTLAKERDALVHRVNDATTVADQMQKQIQDLRRKVDQAQQQALQTGDGAALATLAVEAGTVEVTGPGVRLVIEDASGTGAGGSASNPREAGGFQDVGRLRDRDLQLVVNGLWQAGAEAISVNGQRLTTLSAIRAAGDAILVDNRPLVPPYTVLAIGDGPQLASSFQEGEAGHYLHIIQDSYGIKSSLSVQKKLTVPAALGITLRYAQPVMPEAPSKSPSAGTSTGTGAPTP